MKIFVHPSNGITIFFVETDVSKLLITVVPTAHTFFLFFSATLIFSDASLFIIICSDSILCFERSSTIIGENVPKPT